MASAQFLKTILLNGGYKIHSSHRLNFPRVLNKNRENDKYFHSSVKSYNLPRLSPQEVSSVLRANEFSHEFALPGSVKSYDSNQLQSNNPIEDTRAEARMLNSNGILVGVFDGHGGAACAQVIAKRLFNYISAALLSNEKLQSYCYDSNEKQVLLETFNDKYDFVQELKALYANSFQSYLMELIKDKMEVRKLKEVLENAFLKLDEDLSKEALDEKNISIDKKTLMVSLSGAVACVAHIEGADLHVASVGDCQAVLGVKTDTDTWIAKKLSIEHNTDNPTEVDRILSEHPPNERDTVIKTERLLGQLAPLRAFGDFRYKWDRDILDQVVVSKYGEEAVAPHYFTPPYLTARPDVTYHRLTPKDKFLVIASDGLWDLVSPLQAVRLVGEHMSGKVTLNPLRLPRMNMKLKDISALLKQRHEGLNKVPIDKNAATHLIRNALGGTEYGVEHSKISQLLSLPQEVVRLFRDDITVTVVYFDSDFLWHCPI